MTILSSILGRAIKDAFQKSLRKLCQKSVKFSAYGLTDHVITTMWKCLVLFLLSTSYVACAVPNEAGFIRGAQNVSGELGIIP